MANSMVPPVRTAPFWGMPRWCLVMAFLGVLGATSGQSPVRGQEHAADTLELIERYRTARHEILVRRAQRADDPARVLPTARLPVPADSLFRSESKNEAPADSTPRSFPIEEARSVHPLEREWFRNEYGDTGWSFLGAGSRYTFFDTTYTRDLRARLQAQFGDPTQTLADRPKGEWESEAQFEYWFVVNDSIPVRVTDANGPRDRGLILSTDRRLRERLPELRDALLRPLREPKRAPYVDYYYEQTEDDTESSEQWYRTGFDGRSFFIERIPPSAIRPRRRPRLETTVPADSAAAESVRSDPN